MDPMTFSIIRHRLFRIIDEAVITLKQGFGRLIRSLTDRGVLMLLDPRIRTARYGKTFLESLPAYRRTEDIGEVERFFAG